MSRIHKVLIPFSVFSFTLLALIPYCTSIDETSVTFTRFINDSQTITSSGKIFKLGFFSPGNSSNRYVGIWYNTIAVQTIVWVANKDNPLKDSFGSLKIANDGNLVVLDGKGSILWSSNVSNIAVNDSMAELLDNGNLVLRQVGEDRRTLWESFDDPSNTFLPSMQIGMNKKTGKTNMLNSWKSDSDPSNGNFLIGLEVIDIPQLVIWNGTQRHRRSGPWNNQIFIGVPNMFSVYLDGFHVDNDPVKDTIYMTYNYVNKSSFKRYILDHSGELFGERWDEGNSGWIRIFSSTTYGTCDDYSKCGSFGSCNILDSPICTCLRGFRAKNQDEWSKGNWSSGCIRNIELKCERNKNGSNDVSDEKDDAFFKLEMMQVPDFAYRKVGPKNLKECEQECLTNCSCSAYSFDGGVGCMIWIQTLLDMQKYSKGTGVDLYIRVAHSELDQKKKLKVIIITVTVLIGTFIMGVSTYFWRRSKTNRKGKGKKKIRVSLVDMDGNVGNVSSGSNVLGDNTDLEIFKVGNLAIATNHFDEANKLGEGGFGSVYKGILTDGQEIAVKRLSKSSGQGLEEFKSEVLVISKLQHRNLVRLLGCCIEGEEKILIYEYMPNKSLDAFLFDRVKRALLDWPKRYRIIEGVSRGILYLHRDSRLKVIHRDLKASNILLDEDLNPKISDFGMARIFGSDELQAKTRRVVGTYGYMSPEYAMEGRFSEKSDVFSFGVLLLEIVSGKKNNNFDHEELALSLLGYAWKLWNENKIPSLIDPTILSQPSFEQEILRCIHVGLLCVQEFAKDRPTMPTILSMLTSEIAVLPTPKQPAFFEGLISSESSSLTNNPKMYSVNTITMTTVEGR